MTNQESRRARLLTWLIYSTLLVTVTLFLFHPLYDPDFYWHLKTGEWIWQQKSLMTFDPFTVPPEPTYTQQSQFTMSAYWLAQLTLYAFYSLAGLPGIIAFRFLTAFCLLYGFVKLGRGTANIYSAASMGTCLILLFYNYFAERPQFFSFVIFYFILFYIWSFLDAPDKFSLARLSIPLSLLMLLWGNLHGGFLLGQTVLIFVTASEYVKIQFKLKNALSSDHCKILFISALLATTTALINPSPLISLRLLFNTGFNAGNSNLFETTNLEYASVFKFITLNHNRIALIYIALMLFVLFTVVSSKQKTNISKLGILAITMYMACKHIRFAPFFFISASFFLIHYFNTKTALTSAKIAIIIIFFTSAAYTLSDEPRNISSVLKYGFVPAKDFPVAGADIIEKHNLNGNIFNYFDWGGYLIWRFGDKNKIFCDGRTLNLGRSWEWLNANYRLDTSPPYWKELVDKYTIQTIILPFFGRKGERVPLTNSVRSDKDWQLVFAKDNTAIFRRVEH